MRASMLALMASLALLIRSQAAEEIKVCTFSTVLTEIAQQVGGDRVKVSGLVKPGIDPHEYEPTPADLQIVSQSQLILASGKGMEGYLTKLKESAGAVGDLVTVGDRFPSLKMKPEESEKAGGAKEVQDPHWWHSVDNVERAAKIVRDELDKISPADKALFARNTDAYLVKLEELKGWVKRSVAELPRDKRKLVTSHNAFQYFARDYGFTIYAIEGVSTQDEASNKKVAEIIDTIKQQQVRAIFLESVENPKVLKEITRETGAKVGGSLYADGLGTGSEGTYDGMMRHNVTTIVEALK